MSTTILRPIRKSDADCVVRLQQEFDEFLQTLSNSPREPFDFAKKKALLVRDGFGRDRAFSGFLALVGKTPVGYVLYHPGYDPDELSGRVLHVVDLFVTADARGRHVGQALMRRVAEAGKNIGAIAIYFAVWTKNAGAIRFYEKLGAKWVEDVPFMKWRREDW